MKKKSLTVLVATALASSVLFSSCIGSFGLSNKLLDWNQNIDNKFVNELVFIVFWIVPVYEISVLADVLVLNSIEFWSGSNPVADAGIVKTIETKDGTYAIETKKDGYHIQKEGEEKGVDLVFNEADQTWSAEANGESVKLLQFKGDDEVVMYLPDGKYVSAPGTYEEFTINDKDAESMKGFWYTLEPDMVTHYLLRGYINVSKSADIYTITGEYLETEYSGCTFSFVGTLIAEDYS